MSSTELLEKVERAKRQEHIVLNRHWKGDESWETVMKWRGRREDAVIRYESELAREEEDG